MSFTILALATQGWQELCLLHQGYVRGPSMAWHRGTWPPCRPSLGSEHDSTHIATVRGYAFPESTFAR